MNTKTTQENKDSNTTVPARKLGRLHGCEPDEADWDNAIAGNTWELDAEDGDETSVGDFLLFLQKNSDEDRPVLTHDLFQEWGKRGKPTSEGPCADLIREAVRRSLAAGYDCYDSDTRTWVFSGQEECDCCQPDDDQPPCAIDARELVAEPVDFASLTNSLPPSNDQLRQAFGALLDSVEAWSGGEECMGCEEQVADDGCSNPACVVSIARRAYDMAFPLQREANARLMAAAPDLLAALEAVLKDWTIWWDGDEDPNATDAERTAVKAARAAIANARGGA